MHFTTLFILKGEKLKDLSSQEIEKIFSERFCCDCGETRPKYQRWCDWFQIGGRWGDPLKAKKGIHCERGWSNGNAPIIKGEFAIVDIGDLTEKLPRDSIFSVATKSRIYQEKTSLDKYNELLDKIDNKQISGVIAFIDCHN